MHHNEVARGIGKTRFKMKWLYVVRSWLSARSPNAAMPDELKNAPEWLLDDLGVTSQNRFPNSKHAAGIHHGTAAPVINRKAGG